MKKILSITLLLFFIIVMATGCDITNLLSQETLTNEQTREGETIDNNSSEVSSQDNSSGNETKEVIFKNLVKTNPEVQYEITNREGYYFIGPMDGHLINIQWDSINSFNFRLSNGKTDIISKGRIDENGVKINAIIEAPAEGMYINEWLRDEKGLIFLSLMNEKNFYWYRNNELKEYKNIQYYLLSPLQKYIILFFGDYTSKPVLMDLASGKESDLPIEADHGWPVYSLGISFSADESKLLFEDWSKMELCIYDIKGKKELQRISEKGYSMFEASFSPNGKMAAFLKYDDSQQIKYLKDEGRSSLGHKLVVYDLEKKKVIKEIEGEPFVYARPIWSPNGKYLIVNMTKISTDKEAGQTLQGSPYLLNISTGNTKKLIDNEAGLKYVIAWSDDNRKVIVNSSSEDTLNSLSAIDINLEDELSIDSNNYYISRLKKSGTDVYEIISIENSKLDQYSKKSNIVLSPDEKYIAFSMSIDNKEYIIVGPRQAASK